MKHKITLIGGLTAGVLIAISASLIAGPVTLPNTFSSGTPARASEVNGNFTAVKSAVDDNAARIVTLESSAANPNVTGNITLAPSTPTTGNILKGTAPFIHNFGAGNTFIGVDAGNFTMTGISNTASGTEALASNTTGEANAASGAYALGHNTTGSNNTASGTLALFSNTTGIDNTASGRSALGSNTTGGNNTASGAYALISNTIGSNNSASGRSALGQNSTGGSNTASGAQALFLNRTGSNNTASGVSALNRNVTGSSNTAIGVNALFNNTGSGNIAIGFEAGVNLTTGTANIAIGNAGLATDTSTIMIGTAQTRTFIAGIRGVTTSNANAVNVVIDSVGQLGTANSSRRVKDHIGDMGAASGMLMKLRPVTFYYKSDQNPSGRSLQFGLIAEEVAAIAPELVARSANGEIETVYYQFLTPMLLNEFQQQQRTIEAQAVEIAQLKQRTARIEELEKHSAELADLKQQLARITGVLGRLEQADLLTAVR